MKQWDWIIAGVVSEHPVKNPLDFVQLTAVEIEGILTVDPGPVAGSYKITGKTPGSGKVTYSAAGFEPVVDEILVMQPPEGQEEVKP